MERAGEVEQLVERMYEQMRAGDGEAAGGLIADGAGVLVIGTDADEWWDSSAVARQAMREQHEAAGAFDIRAGGVRAQVRGDVGWFDDRPTMRLPDGTEMVMRVSGVATRADGDWRIVQLHVSVAASVNEALFG
jgi:hypothetical protein